MSKDYTHIKANGLRNELKSLNKNIEQLTNVILMVWGANTQTDEESNNDTCNPNDGDCKCKHERSKG